MPQHEKINYVEYPSRDLQGTKLFFARVFGWEFVDYGAEYAAFSGEGLDGGFFKSGLAARTANGSALIVFYSDNLQGTLEKVVSAGGEVVKPIFDFPGGRRFHFFEPGGNEFAVWAMPEA